MGNKKKKSKTYYCKYWNYCDRKEDCFNGEYCPVMEYNPDLIQEQFDGKDLLKEDKTFENMFDSYS